MPEISLLGFIAGALTTISFVPQVLKAWRTRRCEDISWGMLVSFAVGVSLWVVYGFVRREAPIITANVVTLALVLMIVAMKVRFASR
jgi:MtN3 and saliva related transmembrane protein